VKTESEIIPPV